MVKVRVRVRVRVRVMVRDLRREDCVGPYYGENCSTVSNFFDRISDETLKGL